MKAPTHVQTHLQSLGIENPGAVHYNLHPPALYEQAFSRDEGSLAAHGPLVVDTAPHTGRSPSDRFLVREASTEASINWNVCNQPIDEKAFDRLLGRMSTYATGRDLFVQDLYAGNDRRYELPVRVVTEKAWHSLFARNMFVCRPSEALLDFQPGFTVLDFCEYEADPARDSTNSNAFVLIHMSRKLVIIGGTHYGGEIKKSIFSVLNYMLPERGVFPMHCSANYGKTSDDVAIFFGLSGTGKTTLSADESRSLIGDDEHGWSDDGVYNFEGGCYAKMIRLSPEGEPEIFSTTKRFGTLLENVVMDPETRVPDFDDASITQNTRGSYPLHFIPNADASGQGGHPNNLIFLTCDAFGVMPPIAALTPEQAMYHFLSGYTAKVAGTERGISEPQATFSACFGEPFMVRHPAEYARMLGEKIRTHGARCWLVNTGWTGGAYGNGERMPLAYTRAMVDAALGGQLDDAPTETDPTFGFAVPTAVPNVPDHVLSPRATWDDASAYDEQADRLAAMFTSNFEKYDDQAPAAVREAGPRVAQPAA